MNEDQRGEVHRIRQAYAERSLTGRGKLYHWSRADVHLNVWGRDHAIAMLLAADGWDDLADRQILDVGCGYGAWLRRLADWGADPACLHGVDLVEERIGHARRLSPAGVDLRVDSGYGLPYGDASMDLVAAQTVFSSILDEARRRELAAEMRRVTRPGGRALIYDFRYDNPRNPDVRALRASSLRQLFPGWRLRRRSLTLLPPLARRLAGRAPALAVLLERGLPPLRSHLLALLHRPEVGDA
ncbi:MAG: class I SAM-dependent methyltransferase [Planctomycetota bacterium]